MIWIAIAVMTAGAVLAVLWPLSRKARELGATNDVAVYKDQLEEIERDQNWGLIAPPEADAARVEVSRRLIAAADAAARREAPASLGAPRRRRVVAVSSLVGVPVVAVAIYLAVGSPGLPGEPLAARMAQAHGGDQSVEELFARVEQHLQQNPDDGRGWEVVAPIYMRLGRYDDAVKARRNALRLLGDTAERYADLGEALVALQNGVVSEDAKTAFDQALRIDPTDVTAQFYRGLGAEQDGRKEDAARIWRALVAAAPPGAEWIPSVQRALARVEGAASGAAAAPAGAGPAAQNDMIRGMVQQLAARLQQDGSDADGWIRLVRSYTVLNEPEKARAAEADARRALAGDADKLARLEAGLKEIAAQPATAANDQGAPAASGSSAAGSPPSHDQSIDAMVARLAARLQRDGSDVDGWIQLVRSYTVLNQPDKARAAGDDGRHALAGDADKLARLEEGIKQIAAQRAAVEAGGSATAAAPPPAPTQDQSVQGMVARLAARLQRDGSDVDGWIQLVRSYTVLNEPDKARAAGDDARRALAGDADKLARLEEGIKQIAAQRAAAASEPARPEAPAAPPAQPAQSQPAQSQDQMIRGMVDRLAARLHQDGSDVDGWLRLLRSYVVLGDADKARAAAADARAALKDDPDKLQRLEEGAKSLGVGG
ncbi:MAG TPA: c-type cytochrome biogenesis protein CcmI [Xanthobacteraceae bacterium]|nr:c-type cytochrome biogenesis protein CcmI [Xanthobacteraceae bacterium]